MKFILKKMKKKKKIEKLFLYVVFLIKDKNGKIISVEGKLKGNISKKF